MAMQYNPETGQYEQDDRFFDPWEELPPDQPNWQQNAGDEANNPFPPATNLPPGGRVGGPGGMDRNVQPDWSPGDGMVWKYDAANGWYPSQTSITGSGNTPGDGPSGGYQGTRGGLAPINYPEFSAPRFTAPDPFAYDPFSYEAYQDVDPFSYEAFQAPTVAEAQSEPGFEYALNQGVKAYENSKAYLGTYRTGGTIKGLNDYARNMANQNYNQVFERKGETYDRNRGNAFDTFNANRANKFSSYVTNRGQAFDSWNANRENAADAYATNYGVSRDVFDRNYTAAKDEYAPRARATELQFGRDWDQYAYEGDDDYRRWKALVDANAT